jgi:hypothetical protein
MRPSLRSKIRTRHRRERDSDRSRPDSSSMSASLRPPRMKITSDVFEAYLKCPTKCWLRSTGEPSAGGTYPEWVKAQNDSYRTTGTERLLAESPKDEVVLSPDMENVKGAKWRLASGLGGAGADEFLCPRIRTPRGRTRARRRPRQASPVHSDPLPLHQQAEQGRQTEFGTGTWSVAPAQ